MSNGPEVTEGLAHEFVKSLHDLRHAIDENSRELREMREELRSSSTSGVNERLDILIEGLIEHIGVLQENTDATAGVSQRIDLLQGVKGLFQNFVTQQRKKLHNKR